MSNSVAPENLTPDPFPSGKGRKMWTFRDLTPNPFPYWEGGLEWSGVFPLAKGLLPTIWFSFSHLKRLLQSIWLPFPLGKGLGVRFFGPTSIPGRTLFTGASARPVVRIAAVITIVVQNLEPPLPHDVLVERETRRQPGTRGTRRLLRIRQLRPRIERREFFS